MRKQRGIKFNIYFVLCWAWHARAREPKTCIPRRERDVFNNKRSQLGQAMIYVSIEGEFGNSWPTDRRICIQTSPLRPHIRTQSTLSAASLRQLTVGPRQSGKIELAVVIALPLAHRHTCPGFVGAMETDAMQIASQLTALFLYCVFALLGQCVMYNG